MFFLLTLNSYSQEPTDCFNSVVVCGNSNVNLDVSGIGVQELNNSNTCSSRENNSIWLRVSTINSGTLGFTLTPTSSSISEDYDFFVFGPNVSCDNIGQAIRCSTTNPSAAGQSNNLTGMNGSANDTSEGPGPDGNSFVRWIDTQAGDTYYIVIDRPIGNSSFSLEWTGTAEFSDPPVNQVSAGTSIDLESCDITAPFDDGLTEFNLDENTSSIVGTQSNVTVSYHLTESDANINTNELPETYTNIQSPQTIYYRITDNNSNCFDIGSFDITTSLGPDFNDLGSVRFCDDSNDGSDTNGRTLFDLDVIKSEFVDETEIPNTKITYHGSIEDAENGQNALPENYNNITPNQEQIYVRIEDTFNPDCNSITALDLIVDPLPVANNVSLLQCDEDGSSDGFTLFNLLEIENELTESSSNVEVNYYNSLSDAESNFNEINPDNFQNAQNPQSIYAKVSNISTGCYRISMVSLEVSLTSTNDAVLELCDDENEDGFQTFNLQNANSAIIDGLITGLEIAYYETYENALLENTPLSDQYTNIDPYSQTIFARVENSNACYGISEVQLTVFKKPQLEQIGNGFYCLNFFPQTITLDAGLTDNVNSNYQYIWSTGESTPTIDISSGGIYTVEVINTNGCSKTRSIDVQASNMATIETIEVIDAAGNNSVLVSVNGEGNYIYALDNDRLPFQESNRFENVSSGFHTVFVRDLNGCGTISRVISVIGFPKFFTPNNDGFNDFWKIDGINTQFQPNSRLKIYDRFGKLIKEVDPLSGWDGTFNGDLLPTDDYWFSTTLEDGRKFNGHFTLKR